MTLTINTNMGSLITQNSLAMATKSLNRSITRMTTGYSINNAGDDSAGYAVVSKMESNLSASLICMDNVAMGSSLLSTAENNYDLIIGHMQRIRDLTEEAANGTYASDSVAAINLEIKERFAEIDRISASCIYNGIKLLDGSVSSEGIDLQIGVNSSRTSVINLKQGLFGISTARNLIGVDENTYTGYLTSRTSADITRALDAIDKGLADITARQTEIGANQNRLDSAVTALTVQHDTMASSISTIKDADLASESSSYIKSQILQQASATLLATANQTPAIALNLL